MTRRIWLVLYILLLFSVQMSIHAQDCATALPPRLIPGESASVLFTDGSPLNMRDTASRSGNRIGQIPEGSILSVQHGPFCADSIWWWQIQWEGLSGWIAEGADGAYFVEPDISAKFKPGEVLVYYTDEGLKLASTDRQILIEFNGLFPNDEKFSDYEYFYREGSLITAITADGGQRIIETPVFDGELVDYLPTPDGNQIAWLFLIQTDVTASAGGPCGDGIRCFDRDYTLLILDDAGQNAQPLWTQRIEDRNNGLFLDLLSWRDDLQAVFIVRNPMTPSGGYPVMGDAIFEVLLGGGESRTLLDSYLGITALAVSPDGHWTAQDVFSEGGYLPLIQSDTGISYPIMSPAVTENIQVTVSSEYVFSPDNQFFYWVELHWEKDNLSSASTTLRGLSLVDGSTQILAQFASSNPPTLPVSAAWLSDDLLIWNYDEGTFIYDMKTGQNTGAGLGSGLSILIGAIQAE